ncbi:50S ribosomal protein L1 [Treponema sp.]|uniref:50S ribosomal protein L1 n=1 Tax=Treponema sp. TaxID=166 RepID=UPI001D25B2D6|nr:50S ribosomal protein L1 [Treponema sp.]MCI6443284.1 50S ribosomal protein L1 [Spirochaetia bacterium]MDO4506010.1 50S ribosomal protein L1 [Spirochaetales bacterium]MBS7242225.1 50S ribosomal protein L1 [Treponema sp.]MCQ2241173.1 50S ribosomal protein L1 [Treponema sp.]MDY4133249.1 50S ribosomal protein L1 [Treponema sp.]
MKHGKKYMDSLKKYDPSKAYDVPAACQLVKDLHYVKFDETVELSVTLKLEKNQTVRDTLVFPHQFTAEKRVLVFCKEERAKEALDAGATYAGPEYLEKVKGGWLDFDVAVATPDMMKDVGRLGMVLGRKGLMPNPKTGTVTPDIAGAVAELKKGRTEFRADKTGVVHIPVGKVSMDAAKTSENVDTFLSELQKKKPADAKVGFIRSVSISSSMGPGVWIDFKEAE